MLDREEYIEQAHFFRALGERITQHAPIQDLLAGLRDETLSTTKLPLAIDYMLSELRHLGVMAAAMTRLNHYFSPFQTYLVAEAEEDSGRFDMRLAFEVLHREAKYRAENATPQGMFLYQFETICRNRLRYDPGLAAVAWDPILDDDWKQWVLTLRRQIGLVDFAEMVYVRSQYYRLRHARLVDAGRGRIGNDGYPRKHVPDRAVLFGENEGKIAWANRRKDPLYLFSALQRQLGYPQVPRPQTPDDAAVALPGVLRRVERLETRLKLVEEERSDSFDLTKFYQRPDKNVE